MKLAIMTVAEPCPRRCKSGAPWRPHRGPNDDADEYLRRLAGRWALEAPGLDTFRGLRPDQPGGRHHGLPLDAPDSPNRRHQPVRAESRIWSFGSGAAAIVHTSTAPALVVPVR